jgi:DNA-directed RNA polymerase specialized sigma24 family protein
MLARLTTGTMTFAEEIVQDAFAQLYRNWSAVEYPVTHG